MKITKIELIPVSLPPVQPQKKTTNIVVIKMHTDEGIIGIADGGEYGPSAASTWSWKSSSPGSPSLSAPIRWTKVNPGQVKKIYPYQCGSILSRLCS